MLSLAAALTLAAASGPTFIEDNYPQAIALAKQQHLPLLIDAWTTWCHTCRFLRATLLKDPAVGAQSARFVWLSVDTEKAANAAFDAKFPVDAFPTFLIVDPASEAVALRWAGGLSTSRFLALLNEGEAAVRGTDAGPMVAARKLDASRKPGEAAAAYGKALEAAAPGSAARGKALEAEIIALQFAGGGAACAQAFVSQQGSVPKDGAYVDAATTALSCAIDLGPGALLDNVVPLATEALTIADVNDDDRSSLYETLVEAGKLRSPSSPDRALGAAWLSFLDGAAIRATSTEQRAALDPHRIEAAEAAGDLAHVRPLIERTARELPADYNAHARLATLYGKMGLPAEALAANGDALKLAYGPRRLRLLEERARFQRSSGALAAALQTLDAALAEAATFPSERTQVAVARLTQERLNVHSLLEKR